MLSSLPCFYAWSFLTFFFILVYIMVMLWNDDHSYCFLTKPLDFISHEDSVGFPTLEIGG